MRDFRDSKSMARALRDALQAKAVETTHSECLELIAKTFGFENWNILAAKIETAPSYASGATALAPAEEQNLPPQKSTVHCSFCGKSQHEVSILIAGPNVFICNECVEICDELVQDKEILRMLETDEGNGNQDHPTASEHMRAKSTADVTSCVERNREGAERYRAEVHLIQRILSLRDGEPPAEDLVAAPRFAALKDKTREDLSALEQKAKRLQKGHEDVLRFASTVLAERTSET